MSITLDCQSILVTMATSEAPLRRAPKPAPKAPVPIFIYYIRKGVMTYADGTVFASGLWSGQGEHMNKPESMHVKGKGPLPVGLWEYGFARDGGQLGPLVLPLHQVSGETFGRSAFYVHGASARVPETSSRGCIIMPRAKRVEMDAHPARVRLLEVRA